MNLPVVQSDKVDILGSRISIWDLTETVTKIRELVDEGGKNYICISNVHTVVMGTQDPSYARVTNAARFATADGVPLIWASGVVGGPKIHGRASGPDVLAAILKDPKARHLRHLFYGSTNVVLTKLRQELSAFAPEAMLVGFYSPPIRQAVPADEEMNEGELQECRMINDFNPDVVWVGLGAPKQEIWMYRARKHLNASVLVGVGAAFDFLAGTKQRAPMWMQKSGLEWAYRLGQEPHRLAARYFKTNPLFVAGVFKQALRRLRG